MSADPADLVAIGVGNVLRADDGVGVRVIESLVEMGARDPRSIPAATRLVDGGTLGMDLLGAMDGARGLVLVDAVRLGGPVGTVSVLRGDAILSACGTADGGSTGAVGELLAVARLMGWLPEAVSMVGIDVGDIGFGLGLTADVERALPAAVAAVGAELRRMDCLSASAPGTGDTTARVAGSTAIAGATA